MINRIIDVSNELLSKIELASDFYNRDISEYKDGNIVLIGMRRLGKTEYLKFRAIDSKLKSEEILYLNFDLPQLSIIDFTQKGNKFTEFIDAISALLNTGKIKLVLFDEIQKIKDWSRLLKGYVDQYKDITFVATGSDALDLSLSSETGVGRYKIIYIGPILFKEFKKSHPDKSFVDYINYYSFPQGKDLLVNDKYQAVIEKQVALSKISRLNIDATLRAIALNPGNKVTRNALATQINSETDSKVDPKQVENVIDFLIKSNLIISLPDIKSSLKATRQTIFTLYPYDWNMYMYYEVNKKYENLESKINGEEIKSLPTKGFVFENMVISNVYSSLRTSLDKNRIFNKVEQPDVDFILDKVNYEIKSFDVLNSPIAVQAKIITKAKQTLSTVIHTGKTSMHSDVQFINVEEFLLNL